MKTTDFIPLNEHYINQKTSHQFIIEIYDALPSTNEYLKQFVNAKKPRICFAEQQTHGKGSQGRYWHSPFGQNIYFSFLYPFQKDISRLAGLSLVVSLAIVKTLTIYPLPNPLRVKWPNDVLYENKKLSGCLIEIHEDETGFGSAIIGIGLNINMNADNDQQISQPWISLKNILNMDIDRNPICIALISNLLNYIQQFEKNGLFSFIAEWQTVDAMFDKNVTLICANHKIHGQAKGINEFGHLLLKLSDGTIRAFATGEASLNKN